MALFMRVSIQTRWAELSIQMKAQLTTLLTFVHPPLVKHGLASHCTLLGVPHCDFLFRMRLV